MKKLFYWFVGVIIFAIIAITILVFLNAKFDFLPNSLGEKMDFVYEGLFGNEGNSNDAGHNTISTGNEEETNMILLSSLISSPGLKKLDICVPNNTYILTSDEVEGLYKVTEGTVIAAHENADKTYTNIIINDHATKIESGEALATVRDQVAGQLQTNYPHIFLESSNCVKLNGVMTIPIIEMFAEAEQDDISVYSCIAFLDVKGSLFTITINHYGDCDTAFDMFNQVLSNLIIY